MNRAGILALVTLVGSGLAARPLSAQSAENVAVVINDASPASQRIGEYYVRKRAIPPANVIHVRTSTDDAIERPAYLASIEGPIASAIARQGLQDRVLYIVLTKGIPLRVAGTGGVDGTVASVDSELTLLYRRMVGRQVPIRGRFANPYYLGTKPVREAQPFSHREQEIYLVSRLDAFTVDEAIALVDRAQSPSREGRIVLDQRGGLHDGTGDSWLGDAAQRLGDLGQGARVILDDTLKGARDIDGVLGYYSWGSNDEANRTRNYGMHFVPGALAATFVSTDGRTFQNPPEKWEATGDWNDRKGFFAGSPQTLIGDLIRAGATGVAGHVAEPYLQSTIRPEILFPTYLSGFNLVEAFYLAMPHLSWQTVVIGDPLCDPFPRKVLTRGDLEEPNDPETELPGLFSKRRLEVAIAMAKGAPALAVAGTVRADARLARGDAAGARRALEEAVTASPVMVGSILQLAVLEEQAGDYDKAIERYRTVLKVQPNNVAALNNLAYGLAVHRNALDEALPTAKKAVSLAPRDPTVLDTLGWIEHLAGNEQEAARVLTAAVRLGTSNPEVHLHAAIVFAATGATAASRYSLDRATRLDPSLEGRPDVVAIRARLKASAR